MNTDENKSMSFWKLVLSTLAAALGVQSKKNLERDFQQKNPYPFIAAGIIFTLVFLVGIIFVAKSFLPT